MRESAATAVLVALAVAAFVAHGVYLAVPLVDDAATSVAFARTLAAGHGLRLTPSSQVVEAFSNPLWTLLLALAARIGADPVRVATWLGGALGALALPLAAAWGPAATGRRLRAEDAAPALLAAPVAAYAYWCHAGLETGLHAFLLALSGALLLRALRVGRGWGAGAALGLLALTRPEGVLYAAAAGGFWLACRARERRRPGWHEARLAAAFALAPGLYLAARVAYFAALLPNTYYVKRHADFRVGEYLADFASANAPVVVAFAVGAALALGLRGHRRHGALALLFVGAGALFVWRFKGDWMREWRFLAPLVPCAGAAAAAGAAALRERVRVPLGAAWVAALLAGVAGLQAYASAPRSAMLRRHPELPYGFVYRHAVGLGRHARALGLVRPRVGLPDIGGLSLALRDAEVVDTAMLADYALARHLRRPTAAEDYLLEDVLPDYLDIHGPSQFVGDFPRLMARYEPLADAAPELRLPPSLWVLRGLRAGEDPRCPGGRAAVVKLSPGALAARVERAVRAGRPREALAVWRCAYAYQPDAALPGARWRDALADRAEARADRAEAAGQVELALRYRALATVVDGGDAHRRRRTEALRVRRFP